MNENKETPLSKEESSRTFFTPYLDLFINEVNEVNQNMKFKVVGYITNLAISELQIDDGTGTLTVFFGRRFNSDGLKLGQLIRLFITLSISDSGEKRFYADFYHDFTGTSIKTYQKLVKAERHINWTTLYE